MSWLLWGLVLVCCWGILHTYLIFPAQVLSKYRKMASPAYENGLAKRDRDGARRPAEVYPPPTPPRGESKGEKSPREESKGEKSPRGVSKEEKSPRGESKGEKSLRGESKEEKSPRGESKGEKSPREESKGEKSPRGESREEFTMRGESQWGNAPIEESMPPVAMLMAVHNEEAVLKEKLDATLGQDYPGELTIYIGLDQCSDRSWEIIQDYIGLYPGRIVASKNVGRLGKPNTVNRLYGELEHTDGLLLWLTDASVIPAPDCLTELVRPLHSDDGLALVDAQQIHHGLRDEGISRSEDFYINREGKIKVAESAVYGYLIGPFGGCYTMRAAYFRLVPGNFLVDDFYLCMSAYEAGGRGISSPHARAYETVGQSMQGEFSRKRRIATGNWQNLVRFHSIWWPPKGDLGWAFFSHKVLRWLTPMLGLVVIACLLVLGFGLGNYWARVMLYSLGAIVLLPSLLDLVLSGLRINWLPLRHWRYFLSMNIALLLGFFQYLKGVRSNVWKPSQRHGN